MKKDDYHKLLKIAIEAALRASELILEVYHTDFSFTSKADHSPVTLADELANKVICQTLNITNIPILSEEGVHKPWSERKNQQYLWVVDPLDGTKEFIKKNDEFTVNIALVHKGRPMLGVIYCPVLRELYFGSPSINGACKTSVTADFQIAENTIENLLTSAQKLPVKRPVNPFIVVTSRSHRNKETDQYISMLNEQHPDIRIVSRGSSLKLCMIAEGTADIYPRFGVTNEWDTAAGHAIICLSGGEVYQHGQQVPLRYNKENSLNHSFIAFRSTQKA